MQGVLFLEIYIATSVDAGGLRNDSNLGCSYFGHLLTLLKRFCLYCLDLNYEEISLTLSDLNA